MQTPNFGLVLEEAEELKPRLRSGQIFFPSVKVKMGIFSVQSSDLHLSDLLTSVLKKEEPATLL